MALIKSINAKDTYNFLTDEGLLPNYAFPEQGIQLSSIIYRKKATQQKGQSAFETFSFEYERPAKSGLRELAPGNRFYAEGRRVVLSSSPRPPSGRSTLVPWARTDIPCK
jgi:DEAD/DEAH box helicase domain-containing protein